MTPAAPHQATHAAGQRPTWVRYRVLGMLFLLSMITYIDRVCIGAAGPFMRRDLGLTPEQMGWIFGAFSLAYGIFEIPSGWMGDRFGPRLMLTRIVVWWSAFTALTGRVSNFYVLWAVRFLFGAGEAGAYPNAACAVARWFPFMERARAQGVIWMASRIGGAVAPLIVAPLMLLVGWRSVFYIFGAMGLVWAVAWYAWYRDYPDQKPSVNAEELHHIREGAPAPKLHMKTPWRVVMTSVNMWAVVMMYFTYGYGVQFFFFWLPTYVKEVRGLENWAPYAALPFAMGAFANAAGGWASDALVRRLGLRWGRRTIGLLGLGGSVFFVLLSFASDNPVFAVVALATAFASTDFMLPNCWAVCLDIGRRYSGTVTGFMNTAAQIAGFIASVLIGRFAGQKDWNTAILSMAVAFLLSASLYLVIDASRPLVREEEAAS